MKLILVMYSIEHISISLWLQHVVSIKLTKEIFYSLMFVLSVWNPVFVAHLKWVGATRGWSYCVRKLRSGPRGTSAKRLKRRAGKKVLDVGEDSFRKRGITVGWKYNRGAHLSKNSAKMVGIEEWRSCQKPLRAWVLCGAGVTNRI